MGNKTGIGWTNATWNPVLGCSRVSEGCRYCYAETIAGRFGKTKEGKKPTVYDGLTQIVNGRATWTGKIVETKTLFLPLHWKNPKRIFVNSMSDLFHENITDEQRDRIFAVMALSPQHTFQVLTKRPERMLKYLTELRDEGPSSGYIALAYGRPARFFPEEFKRLPLNKYDRMPWPLPNVWLGVSAENQKTADERIPFLLQSPAAVRFVSAEPLLGPIDLNLLPRSFAFHKSPYGWMSWLAQRLHWVIGGGESGHHARPMPSHWADSIRQQCEAAGISYFHKQNGEWVDAGHDEFGKLPSGKLIWIRSDGTEWENVPQDENADVITMKRVGRKRAGDTLYGKQYHEYPA